MRNHFFPNLKNLHSFSEFRKFLRHFSLSLYRRLKKSVWVKLTQCVHLKSDFNSNSNLDGNKRKKKRIYRRSFLLLGQHGIDGSSKFAPKVETSFCETRSPRKPSLDQRAQTRFFFRSPYRFHCFWIATKNSCVTLIVAYTMFLLNAELIFQKAKLQRLKTRGWAKVIPKCHEIHGGHCL